MSGLCQSTRTMSGDCRRAGTVTSKKASLTKTTRSSRCGCSPGTAATSFVDPFQPIPMPALSAIHTKAAARSHRLHGSINHGKASTANNTRPAGCSRLGIARQRRVATSQGSSTRAASTTPINPLARTASAAAPQANATQRRHAGGTSSTARAVASNLPPGIPCLPKDPAAWVRPAAGFAPRPVRPSAVRCRTDQGTGSA